MTSSSHTTVAGVHLFADISNLIGGARALADERGEYGVRIDAGHLLEALADRRPITSAWAIVNAAIGDLAIARFERAGWQLDIAEPGSLSGREQFADQALQARLFEDLRRYSRPIIVLATGDGAGHRHGHGFLPYLQTAIRAGGTVELAGWSLGMNAALAAWATAHGRLRILDPIYSVVTFVEGGRPSLPATNPRRAA
jgi:hypothetical protein